jgi:hypothetical protein
MNSMVRKGFAKAAPAGVLLSCALAAAACNGEAGAAGESAEQASNATAGDGVEAAAGPVEAWLVDGAVGARFTRVTRPTEGSSTPGCTSTFATGVELFVVSLAADRDHVDFDFELRTSVSTPFGSGAGPTFRVDEAAFSRQGNHDPGGEAMKVASVPDFEIGRICQGFVHEYTQTGVLTDAGAAPRQSSTRLANVLSFPRGALFPAPKCTADVGAANASGVRVERCAGAQRDPRDFGYDELKIRVRSSAHDGDGGVPGLLQGRSYTAWLSLNGVQRTYPMACKQEVRFPSVTWSCALNVVSEEKAFAYDDDGYVVDRGPFTFSRGVDRNTVNAWDVQFALVDEQGNWVKASPDADFFARVEQRTVTVF